MYELLLCVICHQVEPFEALYMFLTSILDRPTYFIQNQRMEVARMFTYFLIIMTNTQAQHIEVLW